MNLFKTILKFIASLFVRAGLNKFLAEHMTLALEAVTEAAMTNSTKPFHEYKSEIFDLVKKQTGEIRDNWIEILISLAYEQVKAGK